MADGKARLVVEKVRAVMVLRVGTFCACTQLSPRSSEYYVTKFTDSDQPVAYLCHVKDQRLGGHGA